MSHNRLETSGAAGELEAIKRSQAGVIDAVLVPRWYWWVVGILLVPLGVAADSHQRVATAVIAVVVALIIAAVSVAMITGTYRGARIHPATLGTAGALYILGFIVLVVGASLVVAFSLQAGHGPFPGTIGTLVAAALLIIGGPILMASLRRSMMERSAQ
jgi:uncharacterized membrane protein